MAEHIVCLTFDFDAMSGFVARGMTSPTPVSRGEFGDVGAGRILDLLAARGVASTWFIPGVTLGTYPDTCRRIAEAGHEVGHHGWSHATPLSMTREQERDGLRRGNEAIEALTGQRARGYRSPAWDLSPHSIELLIDEGFVYDSSMMGHDYLPYRARVGDVVSVDEPMRFGTATDLVEMPVSWTLDDYPHFEFVRSREGILPGLANARAVLDNWIGDFTWFTRHLDFGVLTYTFHPLVIGRGHRMLVLEALIDALEEGGATFMTLEAACARTVGEGRLAG